MLRETAEGVTVAVRAQPGANKTAIVGVYGEGASAQLRVAVQAAANRGTRQRGADRVPGGSVWDCKEPRDAAFGADFAQQGFSAEGRQRGSRTERHQPAGVRWALPVSGGTSEDLDWLYSRENSSSECLDGQDLFGYSQSACAGGGAMLCWRGRHAAGWFAHRSRSFRRSAAISLAFSRRMDSMWPAIR